MPDVFNILAQLAPGATAETVLYTPTAGNKAIVQQLVVCNRSGSPAAFRVSVSLSGAATSTKDYLYYDCPLSGNNTLAAELSLTLNAGDVMRVYASTANLTFTLIGNPR